MLGGLTSEIIRFTNGEIDAVKHAVENALNICDEGNEDSNEKSIFSRDSLMTLRSTQNTSDEINCNEPDYDK